MSRAAAQSSVPPPTADALPAVPLTAINTLVALFERGGLNLGRIAQVPIRLHWTALVGAFVFTGFGYDPIAWACFFGLVIVHELGHAITVKAAGGRATLIELTGYGGLCHWRGDVTPIGRAAIAWGGVWAQLILLAGAEAYLSVFGMPFSHVALSIFTTLTDSNAWLIAVNLVPIAPLDGAEAWRLPILVGRSLRGTPPNVALPLAPEGASHDEAFEAGTRRDEVKAIVSNLLDEARKE